MALATQADVVKALRRDLTSQEEEDVDNLLDEASDLVLGYLKCPPPTPTPEAIVRATASMVAAVLRPTNLPENAETLTAGEYSMKLAEGSTSKSPYLTAALKLRIRRWRCSMVSVPLSSERYES